MKRVMVFLIPILLLGSCASMLKSMGGASQTYVAEKDDQLALKIEELKKSVQELNEKNARIDAISAKVDSLSLKVDQYAKGLATIDELKRLIAELQQLTADSPLQSMRKLDTILQKAIAELEAEAAGQKK